MRSLRSLRRRHEEPTTVSMALLFDPEMIQAVKSGNSEQVEILLRQGANPNATDMLDSALSIAVLLGNLGMTQLLVRYGADLNQRNPLGSTAMQEVVFSDSGVALKICAFLLDHGADINAVDFGGWTPLMQAVDSQRFDMARFLIERGADATRESDDGSIALDLLRRGKGWMAVRKLLEQVS